MEWPLSLLYPLVVLKYVWYSWWLKHWIWTLLILLELEWNPWSIVSNIKIDISQIPTLNVLFALCSTRIFYIYSKIKNATLAVSPKANVNLNELFTEFEWLVFTSFLLSTPLCLMCSPYLVNSNILMNSPNEAIPRRYRGACSP